MQSCPHAVSEVKSSEVKSTSSLGSKPFPDDVSGLGLWDARTLPSLALLPWLLDVRHGRLENCLRGPETALREESSPQTGFSLIYAIPLRTLAVGNTPNLALGLL